MLTTKQCKDRLNEIHAQIEAYKDSAIEYRQEYVIHLRKMKKAYEVELEKSKKIKTPVKCWW